MIAILWAQNPKLILTSHDLVIISEYSIAQTLPESSTIAAKDFCSNQPGTSDHLTDA